MSIALGDGGLGFIYLGDTLIAGGGGGGSYKTFTCYIDESKSDPSQMVTYGDDITYSAGSSDWDNFFGYYPCLLNSYGMETALLKTNDYSKEINGSSVNISSGDNVMVCFPRLGVKMSKSGKIITIKITNDPNKTGFTYLAHSRTNSDKDKFYVGAYQAYSSSDVLKSWSGQTPTTNIGNDVARTRARANGTGYEMFAFYQKTFIQILYVFKYKNLNSQSVIGKGYVGGSSKQTTGATNSNGMNYGTSSTTSRVKLFGIEDLWGNINEWCEGYYGSGGNHYLSYDNFNLTQSNYSTTFTNGGNFSGWLQETFGTSERGFFRETSGGSGTTYYCDKYTSDSGTHIPFMGGQWNAGNDGGLFHFMANNASSSSGYNDIGARIMYL